MEAPAYVRTACYAPAIQSPGILPPLCSPFPFIASHIWWETALPLAGYRQCCTVVEQPYDKTFVNKRLT